MDVLRYIASRVHRIWSHSFLWLKRPSGQLRRRLNHRCAPWVSGAQRFLLLESAVDLPEGLPESIGPCSKNAGKLSTTDAEHPVAERLGKAPSAASVSADSAPADSVSADSVSADKPTANQRSANNRSANKRSVPKRSTGQVLIRSQRGARRTWTVTLLAVLILATCFGQRFYRQPGLDIRSVSPKTFYAPAAAVIEDKKATEQQRDDVRNGAGQILKIDLERTAAAERSLETLLQQGRELREQAGRPNFLNLDTLSQPTQDFLFQASDAEWQTVWRLAKLSTLSVEQLDSSSELAGDEATADAQAENEGPENKLAVPPGVPLPPQIAAQVRSLTPEQKSALLELLAYRDLSSPKGLTMLQTRLDTRRRQYRRAYEDLVAAASTQDQPLYNYRLFELSEDQWLELERNAREIFTSIMLQGVHEGAPEDLLRRAIEARVPRDSSVNVQQLTADVIAAAVSYNLVPDVERTWQQAEQAVRQIDPVMVSVQEGDLIVRANETIDSSDFVLLDHFDLTDRYFNWVGLCGFSVLVAAAVAIYLWVDHRQLNQLNQRDHILVLLLCLVVSILAALRVPTFGLPAVGLLVGSFYGPALGMTVVGLLTLLIPIGVPLTDLIPLVAGGSAALLGSWIAPQLRSREEFALLGGIVGLSQAAVHLVLTLMRFTVAAPLWKAVFVGSALHGLYGIAWSVVALGVSPYLEHFFDVVTPIRLAELSNPNRPLLKRLAAEAPGTFQHTMFVANLAEAAARALGRNVELVRAGTLYHDIGKMHRPQGFIENQMGGPNLHDTLNDPWESASIIKKHVTQGLVMARKYRLPQAVQAFIPEHQGDMKISYFYQQAKERQAKEPTLVVSESDFSYDGPIPQSPETGITMLADSCEAALRSLKPDASIDEAYTMVNKILRARWRNRQLIDSGLSREDMDVIASVFIQVWQQHNHKRIAYPKNVLAAP
ncbi:MAG: HDIG domain-containing metalloprotein [Cyanobacteria bacterium J06607_13]